NQPFKLIYKSDLDLVQHQELQPYIEQYKRLREVVFKDMKPITAVNSGEHWSYVEAQHLEGSSAENSDPRSPMPSNLPTTNPSTNQSDIGEHIYPIWNSSRTDLVSPNDSQSVQSQQLVEQKKSDLQRILDQTGEPESVEAFHLNQLLEVLIAREFEGHPNITPPITYFGCATLQKYLEYCKTLNSDEGEKLAVWDTLEANIKNYVTPANFTNPQYFSKMIMALNLAIAKKSQENERFKEFQATNDREYNSGQLLQDRDKPDTGFNEPVEQGIGNVSVSICEVNGFSRRAQEDQYHVGTLDVDAAEAPSKLKAILAACEANAMQTVQDGSGSTATLTHLSTSGMITVASLGDAPALFLAKDKATGKVTMVPLTRDHEPNHFFEKSRIIKNGGNIFWHGCFRVNPSGLNLTRAIGDFLAKRGQDKMVISTEPDVVQFDARSYLDGNYEVCVLTACDGILNHGDATRQNYADLFGSKKDFEDRNFAQRCVSYALNCKSSDNITVTAAEFSNCPEQGVLLGVFDGHGGKETSKICKDTVAASQQPPRRRLDEHTPFLNKHHEVSEGPYVSFDRDSDGGYPRFSLHQPRSSGVNMQVSSPVLAIEKTTVQGFLQKFSTSLTEVGDTDLVTVHYNTLVETMYQWKNDDIRLEHVAAPLQTPFVKDAQKTHYIGDIHGDLNHLLLSLTQSGLATIQDPPIAFMDVNTDKKISFEAAQKMTPEALQQLLPIPNLTFNKDCDAEVIVLGDILDRGEYMDQCLHVLLDLARQERAVSPESNKLKIVFGDHELYGFTVEVPFKPNYNFDPGYGGCLIQNNSNEIFGLSAPQHDIKKTSASLNKAFQEGLIKYAWMGSHGECCTHSTFTKTFIKNMLLTAGSLPEGSSETVRRSGFSAIFKPEGGAGVDKTHFIQICNELLVGNNTHIADFVDMLNQTFVWLAQHINSNEDSGLLNHPMLQIDDKESNPIWSRPNELITEKNRDSDWLKIPGVIGHTDSKGGHIQCLTNDEGEHIIFDVDVGASDWYREDGQSRARLITFKNGEIYHFKISGKEE
ncbi:MAG: PP2C family protein-serine/threonine phosphatase, partial [Candidatus Margulisiibacteriota bacterium]